MKPIWRSLLLFWGFVFLYPDLTGQFCATVFSAENEAFLQSHEKDLAEFLRNEKPQLRSAPGLPIQLYLIGRDDGSGFLPDSIYTIALRNLQKVFLEQGFDFFYCGIERILSSEWYDFTLKEESALINTHFKRGAINLYCVGELEGGAARGYASLPGRGDLVVMRNQDMSSMIFPHEMGHFFGLKHTHGDSDCQGCSTEPVNGVNCLRTGDLICDTPADPNLAGNRIIGGLVEPGTCNYTGLLNDFNGDRYAPDTRNIMSYSLIPCLSRFSVGQYARMRFFLQNVRNKLNACLQSTSTADFPAIKKLEVWPNPWHEAALSFHLETKSPQPMQVQLIDPLGRMVFQQTYTKASIFQDQIADMPSVIRGWYVLRFITPAGIASHKVLRR
jgi:Pregnancy-associated plasma protein-A